MTRRASKVDANQTAVVSALEAAGASVQSLAPIGKGCPDILAAFRGRMWLFEIKNRAGKNTVNEAQRKWHAAWKADVHVVHDPDEALRLIGAIA
jgi:Holliday junction resolvase